MADIEIRPATEEDFPAMATLDGRAFGEPWKDEDVEAFRSVVDLDRFRVATDGPDLVGVAGSFAQELTVPGGAQVSAGGVTWVAVATSHRRRGLLRRLLGVIHEDIDERGEVVAMLLASEGGIYERFGYGIATRFRVCTIDRRATRIDERFVPPDLQVRIVDPHDHLDAIEEIFERYRRGRTGEVRRDAQWVRLRFHEFGTGTTTALHPDGFASWKVTAAWNDGHPAHEVRLLELVAVTPEAHAALWHTVLSIDLAGPIRSVSAVAPDDPLPYLLTNPRALRTNELNDMLWIRPHLVGPLLSARTYGTDDELVIEVDIDGRAQRWRVEGSAEGGTARKVRSRPDLTLDRAALGALCLGGVSATTLQRGRRLVARDSAALRRADAFFGTRPLPHCATGF